MANINYLQKYFSKDGISSSQANFVADQIKERNRLVASEIENVKPYKETARMTHKSGDTDYVIVDSDSPNLSELCQKEGQMYALSAWLREAIKARHELQVHYTQANDNSFVPIPIFDRIAPQPKVVPKPIPVMPDDVLANFSVTDLADYYTKESQAAHIGKRIHAAGKVAKLRDETLLHREKVTEFRAVGPAESMAAIGFSPTYNASDLEGYYQTLHKQHRAYEQALNNYKARVQNEMSELTVQRNNEYKKSLAEASEEYRKQRDEYDRAASDHAKNEETLRASANSLRSEKLKEIASWKILIPHELKSIYDEIIA